MSDTTRSEAAELLRRIADSVEEEDGVSLRGELVLAEPSAQTRARLVKALRSPRSVYVAQADPRTTKVNFRVE